MEIEDPKANWGDDVVVRNYRAHDKLEDGTIEEVATADDNHTKRIKTD